jgi:hypothetical protein
MTKLAGVPARRAREQVEKQNWLQMMEAAASCPLFKTASRALSRVLFRASSRAVFNVISAITAAIRYFIY